MQTIHRSLDILEFLAKKSEPVLMNDIVEALSLSTTSTYNFLRTLVERGYVKHVGSRKGYTLGPSILYLAENFTALPPELSDLATPYLENLNQLTGESVYLGIFKTNMVEVSASVLSTKWLAMGVKETFIQLHSSSQGKIYLSTLSEREFGKWMHNGNLEKLCPHTISTKKALLEELKKIREQGYSICNEEMEIGACSVAAPVRNEYGKVIGTVAIGLPSVRVSDVIWKTYPQYAIQTAKEISQILGWSEDILTDETEEGDPEN